MCDLAKHDKNKLVVLEAMVHIMAPATKQTKFAAYEAPALEVASLTMAQYEDLTQEQHLCDRLESNHFGYQSWKV
jgi:hypothetical protein